VLIPLDNETVIGVWGIRQSVARERLNGGQLWIEKGLKTRTRGIGELGGGDRGPWMSERVKEWRTGGVADCGKCQAAQTYTATLCVAFNGANFALRRGYVRASNSWVRWWDPSGAIEIVGTNLSPSKLKGVGHLVSYAV